MTTKFDLYYQTKAEYLDDIVRTVIGCGSLSQPPERREEPGGEADFPEDGWLRLHATRPKYPEGYGCIKFASCVDPEKHPGFVSGEKPGVYAVRVETLNEMLGAELNTLELVAPICRPGDKTR